MYPQRAKSEATVGAILDAALGLFTASPYADVSMNAIARAAGLTKGALYHHFQSKESIYLEAMGRDLATKRDLYAAAIQRGEGCRERLRLLTLAHFALPGEKRETIRLVRRDANSLGAEAREALVRAYQAALPDPVERVISEGMAAGELGPGDPRLLAWQFIALVETTMSLHGERVLPEPEAKVEEVLGLFLKGAGSRREAA